jgi:hypothetical protein
MVMSFVSSQNRLPARFYSRLLVAVNVNFSMLFRKSDSAGVDEVSIAAHLGPDACSNRFEALERWKAFKC